ncbi:hypothetical protein HZS_4246, partial [Henneguya salminicola]
MIIENINYFINLIEKEGISPRRLIECIFLSCIFSDKTSQNRNESDFYITANLIGSFILPVNNLSKLKSELSGESNFIHNIFACSYILIFIKILIQFVNYISPFMVIEIFILFQQLFIQLIGLVKLKNNILYDISIFDNNFQLNLTKIFWCLWTT